MLNLISTTHSQALDALFYGKEDTAQKLGKVKNISTSLKYYHCCKEKQNKTKESTFKEKIFHKVFKKDKANSK